MDGRRQPSTAHIERAMDFALSAAAQGPRGANPLVGAVVMDDHGQVLAVGHHCGAGTDHAEIAALRRLGTVPPRYAARLTMVVTLEPCNHHGRTGPCAPAVASAGIGRVVYAVPDPTEHGGGGAAWLERHGVETSRGPRGAAARELNPRWFAAQSAGRPFPSLHVAPTLDGRIAAADGTSQWITGPEARVHSHGVRARVGAIVAGTGTVVADNPRLTARDGMGRELPTQPLRVVMGHRDLPAGAAVAADENWLQVRTHDPATVLAELAARGIGHVLIEGGATVASAFLAADLVDELWMYQAPLLLGSGRLAVQDLGVQTLDQALRWRLDPTGDGAIQQRGDDLAFHFEPRPHPGEPSTATTRSRRES